MITLIPVICWNTASNEPSRTMYAVDPRNNSDNLGPPFCEDFGVSSMTAASSEEIPMRAMAFRAASYSPCLISQRGLSGRNNSISRLPAANNNGNPSIQRQLFPHEIIPKSAQ